MTQHRGRLSLRSWLTKIPLSILSVDVRRCLCWNMQCFNIMSRDERRGGRMSGLGTNTSWPDRTLQFCRGKHTEAEKQSSGRMVYPALQTKGRPSGWADIAEYSGCSLCSTSAWTTGWELQLPLCQSKEERISNRANLMSHVTHTVTREPLAQKTSTLWGPGPAGRILKFLRIFNKVCILILHRASRYTARSLCFLIVPWVFKAS